MKNSGSEHKVTINLKKNSNQQESQNLSEIINKVINYISKSAGSKNFMGSISQRDGNSRPVLYTHPNPGIPNEPISLSSSPGPVGTTGLQQGV